MAFEKKVPEWLAAGTEPPESLKTSGFEAGMKPPAAYFNWFWHDVSQCLKELQDMTPEKIGGAAASHATQHGKSGSDPITPDMIGAAPAGYGLGGNIQRLTTAAELDAFNVSGWKSFYNVSTPLEAGGTKIYTGVVRCDAYSEYYCVQTICSVGSAYFLQRTCAYGEWGEWEWINPPMVLGVEYRTTERWDGKVVYAKYVSYGTAVNDASGALPDGAKTLIRHAGMLDNLSLPLGDIVRGDAYAHSYYSTSGAKELFLDTDATAFGSGAYTWYESLWYVKE